MSKIISFRGLLADNAQDTIVLHTNDGKTGYRITKFQLMLFDPTGDIAEVVVKIFKVKVDMTIATHDIDFSDNRMLAVGYIENYDDAGNYMQPTVIFDNEIFNQDIYISSKADTASNGCNYYIELEQVSLDLNEATVATLKDIRNSPRPL